MSGTIEIGIDLGMGAIKVFSAAGGMQVISQVASNGHGHLVDGIAGLRARRRPMLVAGSFGSFYVGPGAHVCGRPVENLDFDKLTGAPEMRALVYGALAAYQAQYGPFDGPISLMVGLPLQMMTGEDAREYQKAVKGWLLGEHEFTVDGMTHCVEVEAVRQTTQALGALFDYVLDDRGKLVQDRGSVLLEEVGVVSVGFNTIEILAIRDRVAEEGLTRGSTRGVRRLLELVNHQGLYSLGEADERLREGKLKAELKTALPIWAQEVRGEIERVWNRDGQKIHKRFARVLVVGGGALLLQDALTAQFGMKAWVPSDPVISIARGLWKLSVMKK
jgi:hypothetical protein